MSDTAMVTLPSWLTAEERRIAEQFPKDVAKHQLTVLRDDGLYRHLKCAQPEHGWQFWFEVITWPGSLAIRGDMGGGWIFSRTKDMFEFFRTPPVGGQPYRINPGYWAEKLPDSGRSVKVHSEDVFKACVDEALAQYERDVYPGLAAEHEKAAQAFRPRLSVPKSPDAARRLVNDYAEDDRLRFADDARELLNELERAGVVCSDAWEWTFTDWDWPFLWACHAIVWAIGQYDQAKAGGNG